MTPTGEIWLTEQGPEGGDELNPISEGENYGWPLQTYGTNYEDFAWPLAADPNGGPDLVSAQFAWVPSIGVSNLIFVEGVGFHRWAGDLLVSSLWAESLYRIRSEAGRVIYAEPISVGRIRDLVELSDGRLVLWIDGGSIAVLEASD